MIEKRIYPIDIIEKKQKQIPITVLTAYEYTIARLIDQAGIDIILVGDSLGNVFAGFENTIPVTMTQMIYHTQAVSRAAHHALVVADMPFMSYQVSIEEAKKNAGRLIQQGQAQAVKLEILPSMIDTVKAIQDIGIPVMAHIGFTPQTLYQLGGYKIQGKSQVIADEMLNLAISIEKAGCFSIVLEMVPKAVAARITQELSIPTIGIGAGVDCDGQVLVTQDMLGLNGMDKKPKFVKPYLALSETISTALKQFQSEVQNRQYPSDEYSYI